MLDLSELPARRWRPPIVTTVATDRRGRRRAVGRDRSPTARTPSRAANSTAARAVPCRARSCARSSPTGSRRRARETARRRWDADRRGRGRSTDAVGRRTRCSLRSTPDGAADTDARSASRARRVMESMDRRPGARSSGATTAWRSSRSHNGKVNALSSSAARRAAGDRQRPGRRPAGRGRGHRRRTDLRRRRRHLRVRRAGRGGRITGGRSTARSTPSPRSRGSSSPPSAGYALGGGCELALACDYRIAVGAGRVRPARDPARHHPRRRRHAAPGPRWSGRAGPRS